MKDPSSVQPCITITTSGTQSTTRLSRPLYYSTSMSPTPASSLHGHSRQIPRSRRPRNANPYDAAHNWRTVEPPPPTQAPTPASVPTLDEGDEEEDDTQEMNDADVEADDDEVADVVDIAEEIDDGNGDGEGAIEEGERFYPTRAINSCPSILRIPVCRLANHSAFFTILAADHTHTMRLAV